MSVWKRIIGSLGISASSGQQLVSQLLPSQLFAKDPAAAEALRRSAEAKRMLFRIRPEELRAALIWGMSHSSDYVRSACAELLVHYRDEQVTDVMATALFDSDPWVRTSAVCHFAFGGFDHSRRPESWASIVAQLTKARDSETDPSLKDTFEKALSLFQQPGRGVPGIR